LVSLTTVSETVNVNCPLGAFTVANNLFVLKVELEPVAYNLAAVILAAVVVPAVLNLNSPTIPGKQGVAVTFTGTLKTGTSNVPAAIVPVL
jgi:hypothetical protein